MRFIELFAGIGGFRYGLEKANDTIDEGVQQGLQQGSKGNDTIVKPFLGTKQFTCVFANEWDKYACQIYQKNFGKGELYEGDIKEISTESIPDFELLTAGFPCQAFSIAGKRRGFGDTRGTLFFEICRIAEIKQPALLLLENVKGLLNHDGGNTFRIILDSLSELGYDCEWEVLNSKNFGVPQNRERVFIIGHLGGKGGQKIFPIGEGNQRNITSQENPQRKGTRIRGDCASVDSRTGSTARGQHLIAATLLERDHKGDGNLIKSEVIMEHKKITERSGKYGNGYKKEASFCLDSGCGRGLIIHPKIRRLIPTECERLQGFPDGWTKGISNTQRYKCLGNAVTTNVITEIGKKILKVNI